MGNILAGLSAVVRKLCSQALHIAMNVKAVCV